MKLGILQTGQPPAGLEGFGGYPAMFEKLLGEAAYDYAVYDLQAGQWPDRVEACPAYLLTGSASGAYEDLPWIGQLTAFLQQARGKAALVGICFGHQIMAHAFGGKVVQSPKGWGQGAHRYEVLRDEPWLDGAKTITLPASHQDQVVGLPLGAEVIAASAFSRFGMLAYRDQPAISLQLHPEFEPDYATALAETRRGNGLDDAQVDRAAASLREPNDRAKAAGWIQSFLAMTVRGE
ncbi:glutamine amidotransferase-related protein [Novosphingobium sp. JCM 18896]|uniref:glutamine amidotransferase-related protein n=1 Tax=Novosphingobium sp. JCM 18896 TaxID=2989731 RepID=UPI002222AB30|nr:type 1 glutamine amidotransferase [Novosphingobium sp. JCM 18896]MCW1430496.1 type 1 glutamine amidotransferase [Novosphingobium sp. JCM 18896]